MKRVGVKGGRRVSPVWNGRNEASRKVIWVYYGNENEKNGVVWWPVSELSSGTFWLTLKSFLRGLSQVDSNLLERVIRLKTENHGLLPKLTSCQTRVCWGGRGTRLASLERRVL